MSLTRDVNEILTARRGVLFERSNLLRLQRLIEEKRERGILPPKKSCLPTLQETQHHGYNTLFGTRAL